LAADEPTGNLDSQTAETVIHLYDRLVAQDKTIIMVSHDMDLTQRAGHILTLADGEIVAERSHDNRLLTTHVAHLSSSPGEDVHV
jgi:putative ABC transport system ATP-binding protein